MQMLGDDLEVVDGAVAGTPSPPGLRWRGGSAEPPTVKCSGTGGYSTPSQLTRLASPSWSCLQVETISSSKVHCGPSIRSARSILRGWPGSSRSCPWLVVSEVDFDSTLVGGPQQLIDALVAATDLEVYEVDPDTSLAAFSDKLNPVPEPEAG
jgi:hypothetical protein